MSQFDCVICSLNSQYIHSSLSPYCLLAGIKKYAPEVSAKVVEGTVNENISEVAEKIAALSPRVIGLCCYIWNITRVYSLVFHIKKLLPESKIVLGGPEVSYNANEVLEKCEAVDYIISGEGEYPFAALMQCLIRGDNPRGVPGLCYRTDDKIHISAPYISCEEPPSPYTEEYFSALGGRIAYIEGSRGCPYSCAFCLSGRCGGVRFFDIERTKQEMAALAASGTQTIKFVDRTFNANRERARDIFDYILNNRHIFSKVCFHFEVAGDILDESLIKILAKMPPGAVQLEIGIQSFNPRVLNAINRKTNIDKLKQNIKSILSVGNVHTHIDLIAGLPFDNMKTIRESFDTAFSLRPDMLQFGFLKILHGAPMDTEKDLFPCTYSSSPPYEVTQTPYLTAEELASLKPFESALDRLYNSGRFRRTTEYLLQFFSPFDLFFEFGRENLPKNMPLDSYTDEVYKFFSQRDGVDAAQLRDIMVCDRLASNSTGMLPSSLKIYDKNLKQYKKCVPQKKGTKMGFAYLYTQKAVVYVYYDNKDPVTGEYVLNFIPMNQQAE